MEEMLSRLKEKLQAYIIVNNPELLAKLQEQYGMTQYLEDKLQQVMPSLSTMLAENKPAYIIEELCLNEMTHPLRPSRFLYLKDVLMVEFSADYQRFADAGVLTYECINLVECCNEVFESFEFSIGTEDNRFLRYAIIAKIHDYLN